MKTFCQLIYDSSPRESSPYEVHLLTARPSTVWLRKIYLMKNFPMTIHSVTIYPMTTHLMTIQPVRVRPMTTHPMTGVPIRVALNKYFNRCCYYSFMVVLFVRIVIFILRY
jgi:hypothetical protein